MLIFDDSFSALDFKTDAILRKELSQLMEKNQNTVFDRWTKNRFYHGCRSDYCFR